LVPKTKEHSSNVTAPAARGVRSIAIFEAFKGLLVLLVGFAPEPDLQLLELDEALNKLAAIDARKSRLVELRYFGGLSVEETAEVLGVSGITVKREWSKTKAWLYRELRLKE